MNKHKHRKLDPESHWLSSLGKPGNGDQNMQEECVGFENLEEGGQGWTESGR